ncbi:MAG: 2-C-methyl-D-erythritol 4-phosphate cytidylyltransferase [Candidatus Latescibacteria bacterium]|nr:2-C-methyl-D-erythritol 4-phosphate cytidylyltransferase [Candidatus Latescibacterota bacterium]
MNIAVILAAGKGKRFGQAKQFVLIKDKPVIIYSLEKFNQSELIDRIVVVTTKNKVAHVQQLIKTYHLSKITDIIVGGKERQDSIFNALKILPDTGYVAIHDSARPLFNPDLIAQGFKQVKKHQACIPVLPVADTIKQVKLNKIVQTLDRADLYYAQTPQFFSLKLIKKAYHKAYQEKYYATDDAGLVERTRQKIYAITGHKQNIKITEPSDLDLIENYL